MLKMKSKNELFMDAIEFLIDNGIAENQGDIAVKAGLGPNLISRIKNGHVKAVSDDAIRALCERFRDLNIDYLRGKSDCISRRQLAQMKSDIAFMESQRLPGVSTQHDPRQSSTLDDCLNYEKVVQKIYDNVAGKYISNLENQVENQKSDIIRLQNEKDELRETVRILQARVRELEIYEKLYIENRSNNKWPFPEGIAEKDNIDTAHV